MGVKKKPNSRPFSTTSIQSKKSIAVSDAAQKSENDISVVAEVESNQNIEEIADSNAIICKNNDDLLALYIQKESLVILSAQNQDWADSKAKPLNTTIPLGLTSDQESLLSTQLAPLYYNCRQKLLSNVQISYYRLINAGFTLKKVEQILTDCPSDEFNGIVQWVFFELIRFV